jgi:CMP-N-acetylneuraminic acid synthetase
MAMARRAAGVPIVWSLKPTEGARRQDLGVQAWRRNGAVYVMRRDVLLSGRLYGDDVRPVEMPLERSIDADAPSDLLLLNALWETLGGSDGTGREDVPASS